MRTVDRTSPTRVFAEDGVEVWQTPSGYVVADDGGWASGVFDTIEDARAAVPERGFGVSQAKRLRLLKVAVQPTFVVDDGETLAEITGPPQSIPAGDWRDFATGAFTDDDLAALLERSDLSEPPPPPPPPVEDDR